MAVPPPADRRSSQAALNKLPVEGESDAEILPLFFEVIPAGLSMVDTGGKGNLMRLTPTAMRLLEEVIIEGKFYLVRDRDIEDDPTTLDRLQEKYKGHFFSWDRYHIENYLLDEDAMYSLLADDPDLLTPASLSEVRDELRAAADQGRDGVLAKHLEANINPKLRSRLRLNVAEGVKQSFIKATQARLDRTRSLLVPAEVERLYNEVEANLTTRWPSEWKSLCIGRDVLRTYHTRHVAPGLGYEVFRNRLARKIRELGRVPRTVQEVIGSVTDGLSSE